MLVDGKYFRDEPPLECQKRERTSTSPSLASRCTFGQENKEEVCKECPASMSNCWFIGLQRGLNSVTQEELEEWAKRLAEIGIYI